MPSTPAKKRAGAGVLDLPRRLHPAEGTGLDAVLSVHDDLDQALEAVRASAAERPRSKS
jgi:hypothetical protein